MGTAGTETDGEGDGVRDGEGVGDADAEAAAAGNGDEEELGGAALSHPASRAQKPAITVNVRMNPL
ncbi:hypothetical protein Acsp02_62430 [Actinoplanes sp. NBRC 103695]|nr:hypothetical protein Acsp02_62430 [Actinoplanes sp. NBRC 103695]